VAPIKPVTEITADEWAPGDRYGAAAIAALGDAVGLGYTDLVTLNVEPDLEPIRNRQDFKKLIANLEANAKQPDK
jgi:hypothetical protein